MYFQISSEAFEISASVVEGTGFTLQGDARNPSNENLFRRQSFLTHISLSIKKLRLITFFLPCRLGPRELNLSVDQWLSDTLPPSSHPNATNAAALLLSQQQQQQSHQSKIMNVVVPNVACPPAAPKKIRRKPENKVSVAGDLSLGSATDICFVMSSSHKF